MNIEINGRNIKIHATPRDTHNWANDPNKRWMCSQLSGKTLYAEFQDGDLVDYSINGKYKPTDSTEFNAFISDAIKIDLHVD